MQDTVRFAPPLPDWKQSVVQRLGFGVLNKVVLCFSTAFWSDVDMDMFGFCGSSTVGELYMFWNFLPATKQPTLVALNAGKAARVLEEMSDEEIVSRALGVLRTIFKGKEIPEPSQTAVTRWGSDPHARGSYSYVAVGCTGADYDTMALPVQAGEDTKPRLFFAGEHTCRNYPATVHGAFLSGTREATRILEHYPAIHLAVANGAMDTSV